MKEQLRESIGAGERGLQLATPFRWVVPGLKEPRSFFQSLSVLVPPDAVLYCEGGTVAGDVAAFYEQHAASNPVAVARDTVFPVPACFHVAFSPEVVGRLCEWAGTRPLNELFDHVKGYCGTELLFHFHDAFDNDLLVAEQVTETAIAEFCHHLGTTYRREPNVNKGEEALRALLKAMEHPGRIRIAGEPWWRRFWRRLNWR